MNFGYQCSYHPFLCTFALTQRPSSLTPIMPAPWLGSYSKGLCRIRGLDTSSSGMGGASGGEGVGGASGSGRGRSQREWSWEELVRVVVGGASESGHGGASGRCGHRISY